MSRHHSIGHNQCVECGAPANHNMVCPLHEPLYANDNRAPVQFSDDVQPDQRERKEDL